MAVIGEMDVFTVNKDKQYEVVDRKSRQSIEKINKGVNNLNKDVTAGKVWKSTSEGAGWADSDSMSDNQSGGVDITINGVKRTLQKQNETSDSMADNENGGVDITIGGTNKTVAKQADLKEIEKSQNELKSELDNYLNVTSSYMNIVKEIGAVGNDGWGYTLNNCIRFACGYLAKGTNVTILSNDFYILNLFKYSDKDYNATLPYEKIPLRDNSEPILTTKYTIKEDGYYRIIIQTKEWTDVTNKQFESVELGVRLSNNNLLAFDSINFNLLKENIDENFNLLNGIKTDLNELGIQVGESFSESDLDIADENGNVLVKFADGNIMTKNFDSSKTISKETNTLLLDADFENNRTISDDFENNSDWIYDNGKIVNNSNTTLWTNKCITINEKDTIAIFSLESDNAQFALTWKPNNYGECGSYFSVTMNALNMHERTTTGEKTDVLLTEAINIKKSHRYILKCTKSLHENIIELIDGINGTTVATISSEQTGRNTGNDEFPGGRQMDTLGINASGTVYVYRVFVKNKIENPFIVIYGNSITEGDRCFSKEGYAYKLKEYIGKNKVIISGESGSNITGTSGVYNRIKNEIPTFRNKPKYIMVTIGTNGGDNENDFINLKKLIESYGCIPIINVPPMFSNIGNIRKWVLGLNCLTVRFDIATALDNNIENGADSSLFADDIHPNPNGHIKMFDRAKIDLIGIF